MNSFIHAEIFFFATTIFVIIATILLIVCFFYILNILRDARYIANKLRHTTDELDADMHNLPTRIVTFLANRFRAKLKKVTRKKPDEI